MSNPTATSTTPTSTTPTSTTLTLAVLDLLAPLPGFPRHQRYALLPADTDGLLFWLQSTDREGPRFLTVPAGPYFPEYAPTLPADTCAELELAHPRDAELYCVVTVPGGDVRAATANLRAPLVVNAERALARQVVLATDAHPIRCPLRR